MHYTSSSSSSSSCENPNSSDDDNTPKSKIKSNPFRKNKAKNNESPAKAVGKNGGCNCTAKVLVVDDNYYNVVPLKMILRSSFKLDFERAENGLKGVQMYERNAIKTCCQSYFSIILMDIQMPVMDGIESTKNIFETFAKLSVQPKYAHLKKPVIFAMTAHANSSVIAKCVEAGMNGILHKPVNKKGLADEIRKFYPDLC